MKKNYFILTLLISSLGFSQNVTITSIVEGDCPGSLNPRFVELYVNGTVDVTNLRLQLQFNSNTADSWILDTPIGTGSYTNQFLYVIDTNTKFNDEFPNVQTPSTITIADLASFLRNGDKLRLLDIGNSNLVIDQYGIANTPGTGTSWEYTNSYVKRKTNTGPNPIFTESEWDIFPVGSLSGLGTCNGKSNLNQTVQLQSYTTTLSNNDYKNNTTNLVVYPNPIKENGILFFNDYQNNLKYGSVYNILGAKIKDFSLEELKRVNLSDLKNGVYFIKVFSKNSRNPEIKRIIIQQ